MRRYSFLVFVTVILIGLGSPVLAQYSGNYDVGGGNNDFPSIVNASIWLNSLGLSGPVICNIYNTTMWTGQVNISGAMSGLSAVNTLTFQNAPGESPVTQAPYYGGDGFEIFDGADYITIQGIEITGCEYAGIRIRGLPGDSCSHIRILNNYIHDNGFYPGSGTGVYLENATDCEIVGNEIARSRSGIACFDSKRNMIANNMIYDIDPYVISYGIYSSTCQGNAYYYNTVYGGRTCVYARWTFYWEMKNNIFYQPMTGIYYVLRLEDNNGITSSDYNDLYAPNARIGDHFTFGDLITLTDWQTATGLDANSISANPNFVSAGTSNFTLNTGSPGLDSGTSAVSGTVTDDYLGISRPQDSVYDIGSYEGEGEAGISILGITGNVTIN